MRINPAVRHFLRGLVPLTILASLFAFTAATRGTSAYTYNGGAAAITNAYYRDAFYELRYNRSVTVVLFDRVDEDGVIAEATTKSVATYLHMTVKIVHHDESIEVTPLTPAYAR